MTEIRSAVDTVGLALENVRTQAGELASSKVDALRTSIDGLRSAAQGLPDATSVTGAVLSLSEELDNVKTAASSLGTELGVEAMSLYKHVATRDALLDAVAERV